MLRIINPGVHHAGTLLALAAGLGVLVAAQSSSPASEQISISAVHTVPKGSVSTASAAARVQHLAVRGTPDAMEIEIVTSGAAVSPDTQAITGPDRIIVDFPGALPSANLRSLQVNRGPLKAVRSGLFFNNPPITRIVLDLGGPQSYQISTTQISPTENKVVIKLSAATLGADNAGTDNTNSQNSTPAHSTLSGQNPDKSMGGSSAWLQNASLGANASDAMVPRVTNLATANASSRITASKITAVNAAQMPPLVIPELAKPTVLVGFENGLLRIHADKATMAEVLFEVQRSTHAEIAIPSGAEQERVSADLGPASAREVLTALLNGSRYNFIFVGTESNLERVILTPRDSSIF